MADTLAPGVRFPKPDKAWVASALVLLAVALFDRSEVWPTVTFSAGALWHTAPFVLFAVVTIAYVKAAGAETLLSRLFEGRETRMIVAAALLGGLSPFCSCEVIPFIAASLAVGAPLSAVMAFWLASPLMDPAMFLVTSGTLGLDFALGKTVAAVGIGLLGGAVTMALKGSLVFADPLRAAPQTGGGCCCSAKKPFSGKPAWRFWQEPARRETFRDEALGNLMFLLKWLLLAYLIEAVMLRYIPAETIASLLGGDGIWPIFLGGARLPERLRGSAAGGCAAGAGDGAGCGDELRCRRWRELHPRRHRGLGAGQAARLRRLHGLRGGGIARGGPCVGRSRLRQGRT